MRYVDEVQAYSPKLGGQGDIIEGVTLTGLKG